MVDFAHHLGGAQRSYPPEAALWLGGFAVMLLAIVPLPGTRAERVGPRHRPGDGTGGSASPGRVAVIAGLVMISRRRGTASCWSGSGAGSSPAALCWRS